MTLKKTGHINTATGLTNSDIFDIKVKLQGYNSSDQAIAGEFYEFYNTYTYMCGGPEQCSYTADIEFDPTKEDAPNFKLNYNISTTLKNIKIGNITQDKINDTNSNGSVNKYKCFFYFSKYGLNDWKGLQGLAAEDTPTIVDGDGDSVEFTNIGTAPSIDNVCKGIIKKKHITDTNNGDLNIDLKIRAQGYTTINEVDTIIPTESYYFFDTYRLQFAGVTML